MKGGCTKLKIKSEPGKIIFAIHDVNMKFCDMDFSIEKCCISIMFCGISFRLSFVETSDF